ncbi:MAG: stage II sporulation protein P [Lachnospiraceae bacterium]|nr:stage II sporulation protein P [Lachnospiraceae bacterium]
MSMSKKRRLFRRSKWILLFLIITLLLGIIGKNRQNEEGKTGQSGEDGNTATFSQAVVDLAREGIRKLGRNVIEGQSVIMDLVAGSEPVFFETRSVGDRESSLPFSLENGPLMPEKTALTGMEEENRLYQEKLEAKKEADSEEESGEDEEEQFLPAGEKSQFFDWDSYQEMEQLLAAFYTVDPTTEATDELFQVNTLLETDCTIDTTTEGPQILLYHTHSQEAFADSEPGQVSDTIVGAGEVLASLLEGYGYKVLHHKGEYDVVSRDQAYNQALPEVEQLLKENPSIQVVIDLHRDAVPEDTRLVTDVRGRSTAKVMFFNGLSRTRQQGEVSYLKNPYLKENLAFSFQMKVLCDEYYPGFARNIYLRAYRYNMHVCPRTLLVELGAQTNTVEEIQNALEPLAHVLDKVLGGMD